MRKRILPLFLAVLLVLSAVPVWAEDTVCSCDALCTQEAYNGECPVCGGENGDPARCAFHAEGETPREASEETCICGTACTRDGMNTDCPVCGAEDAVPEDCGKYTPPAEEPKTEEAPVPTAAPTTVTNDAQWEAAMQDADVTEIIVAEDIRFNVWSSGKRVTVSDGATLTWNNVNGSLSPDYLEIASGGAFAVSTSGWSDKRSVSGTIVNNGMVTVRGNGTVVWTANTTGSGSMSTSDDTYFNYGNLPTCTLTGTYKINIIKNISQYAAVTLPDGLKVGDTVRASVSNLLDGVDLAAVFTFKWTQNGNERYNGAAEPTLERTGSLKLCLSPKDRYKMRTSSGTSGSIDSNTVEVTLPILDTIYVNQVSGADTNVGDTEQTPVKTLATALDKVSAGGTIVLLSDYSGSNLYVSKSVIVKSGAGSTFGISCTGFNGISLDGNVTLTLDGANITGKTYIHGTQGASNQTLVIKNAAVTGDVSGIPTVTVENSGCTGYIQDADALRLTNASLNGRISVKDLTSTGATKITVPKNTSASITGTVTLTDNTPITLIPANLSQGERLVQVPNGSPDGIAKNFVLQDDNGGRYALKCRPYFSNTTYIGISQKLTAKDVQLAVREEPQIGRKYVDGETGLDRRPTKFSVDGVWSGATGPNDTWAVGDTPKYTVTLSATVSSDPWYHFDEAFLAEELRVYSWEKDTSGTAFTDAGLNTAVSKYFADGQGVARDDGRTVVLTLEYPKVEKLTQTVTGDLSAGTASCGERLEARRFTCTTGGTLRYRSSDPEIASVDASGNVTAHKPGTVTITVTAPETETYKVAEVSYQLTVSHSFTGDWQSDESDHWKLCACGVSGEKAAHSGGKATCTAKAACDICGASYGQLDPDNHSDLRHVPMKAPTYWTKGNKEYWYCADCGKYYLDAGATKEITQAETVLASLRASDGNPKTGDPLLPVLPLLLLPAAALAAAALLPRKKPGGKYLRRHPRNRRGS